MIRMSVRNIILSVFCLAINYNVFGFKIDYTASDSIQIEQLLSLGTQHFRNNSLNVYYGKKLLGIPYKAHTLESPYLLDKNDPKEHLTINLRQFDCTTFVETILTLSVTTKLRKTTFKDYCYNLMRFRYIDGIIDGYTSRNHYYSTWIDNAVRLNLIQEVVDSTNSLYKKRKLNIHYMSSHPELYPALRGANKEKYIKQLMKTEQQQNKYVYYLPTNVLNKSQRELPIIIDGDIIAIETSKDGLDTSHLGIALWHSDGTLRFMNASSIYKKVVISPTSIYRYLKRQKHAIGIRVLRLR